MHVIHWRGSGSGGSSRSAKRTAAVCVDALAWSGLPIGLLGVAAYWYPPAGAWVAWLLWWLSSPF